MSDNQERSLLDPIPDNVLEAGQVLLGRDSTDTASQDGGEQASDGDDEFDSEGTVGLADRALNDPEEDQQQFVSPKEIGPESDVIQMGEMYGQGMFVKSYGEYMNYGLLSKLINQTNMDMDLTIHLDPIDRDDALRTLKQANAAIKAEIDDKMEKSNDMRASDLGQRGEKVKELYNVVQRQDMTMFDMGVYMLHRSPDPEHLRREYSTLKSKAREPPANVDIEAAQNFQSEAAKTISPNGKDGLGWSKSAPAAAAATAMPFVSGGSLHDRGIDLGKHRQNGQPILLDLWDLPMGYNMFVVGQIGSGKTFSMQDRAIKAIFDRPDVDVVIVDPMGGYDGITAAMEGQKITIGGNAPINPLEIKPTPPEIIEKADGDIDPYGDALSKGMDFFETYFGMEGLPLDDERKGVLQSALEMAYAEKRITRDIRTHHRESPTIQTVYKMLGRIMRDGTKGSNSAFGEGEQDSNGTVKKEIREKMAAKLQINLEPFMDGQYRNLGKKSENIDLDDRVTYFDLEQQENDQGTGLMMQVLINAIYERIKSNSRKTVFLIDEAHYMMSEESSLDFLEQAVRHSRHHDLSFWLGTQTAEEFFESEQAAKIVKQTSVRQYQYCDINGEIAKEHLGMTDKHVQEIPRLTPGKADAGYSEGLVHVKKTGWFPVVIKTSPEVHDIIDYDSNDADSDLPGFEKLAEADDSQTAVAKAIRVAAEHSEDKTIGSGTALGTDFESDVLGVGGEEMAGLSEDQIISLLSAIDPDAIDTSVLPEEVASLLERVEANSAPPAAAETRQRANTDAATTTAEGDDQSGATAEEAAPSDNGNSVEAGSQEATAATGEASDVDAEATDTLSAAEFDFADDDDSNSDDEETEATDDDIGVATDEPSSEEFSFGD